MQTPSDPTPDVAMLEGMEGLIAAMRGRPAPQMAAPATTPPPRASDEGDDELAAAAWEAVELPSLDVSAIGHGHGTRPRARGFERGTVVGRHVVLDELGAGGMGVVYAAYDPELDRKVALKLLRPGSVGDTGSTRLLREAQALGKLAHPNVVGIHDVGTVGEQVWLAMEFVQGHTLGNWLAQPRGWRDVLAVMRSAGEGLAAAHAAGLLHRDFKPDNVMLGDDGRVRVMDFGLARARAKAVTLEDDEPLPLPTHGTLAVPITQLGALVGTPGYMAPEQLGGAEVTAAADQFAFCVSLWQALYGERPFGGRNLVQVVANVLADRRRPPPKGRAVPSWLRRACERGLSSDPKQRWPSMLALLDTLAKGRMRARVRKGLAMLGVLATLGAGVEGFERWDLARRTAACERSGDEIEPAWNDERQRALRDGLVATGASYAGTTADKAMPWLDRQAQEWREARVQTCMDAEVQDRWDVDLHERSLWCLDERRTQLQSLVDELTLADADVLHKTVTAAAGLTPVAPCRDERVLRALGLPPKADREAVRAVRADVTRVGNLERAGRYTEGLELAHETLERARFLHWAPLSAAARYGLGRLLKRTGAYGEAETALEDAYFEAADGVEPEVLVGAAMELVHVVGLDLARHADALRWRRHAQVAMTGIRDDGHLRRARLLGNLALIHEATGAYADAIALHEQSLVLLQETLDPGHPNVAMVLSNLANAHVGTGAYDRAKPLQERALVLWQQTLGPDHPDVAKGLNDLALIDHSIGAYDEAIALYEQSLALWQRALGPEHDNVAMALNNLAVTHRATGAYDEALALDERALVLYEKALGRNHPLVAAVLNNLANTHVAMGAHAEARPLYERAAAILEQTLGPDHPDVAMSLDNLAIVLLATGAHERARALHERALDIKERALGPDHPEVARSLNNLAVVLYTTGAHERARLCFERALAIWERSLGPDHPDVTNPLVNLAELALEQRRSSDAVPLAQRAVTVREQGGVSAVRLASARFVLAQALWEAPAERGRDRARARAVAAQARDVFREAGEGRAEDLARVEAWLVDHGGVP